MGVMRHPNLMSNDNHNFSRHWDIKSLKFFSFCLLLQVRQRKSGTVFLKIPYIFSNLKITFRDIFNL